MMSELTGHTLALGDGRPRFREDELSAVHLRSDDHPLSKFRDLSRPPRRELDRAQNPFRHHGDLNDDDDRQRSHPDEEHEEVRERSTASSDRRSVSPVSSTI